MVDRPEHVPACVVCPTGNMERHHHLRHYHPVHQQVVLAHALVDGGDEGSRLVIRNVPPDDAQDALGDLYQSLVGPVVGRSQGSLNGVM